MIIVILLMIISITILRDNNAAALMALIITFMNVISIDFDRSEGSTVGFEQ